MCKVADILLPEDRLRIFNGCSFLTKADVVGDIELPLDDSEQSIESVTGGQLQYLKAKCTSLKQFIVSSRGITYLRLMLVLCPSKQGAFVQNQATDRCTAARYNFCAFSYVCTDVDKPIFSQYYLRVSRHSSAGIYC